MAPKFYSGSDCNVNSWILNGYLVCIISVTDQLDVSAVKVVPMLLPSQQRKCLVLDVEWWLLKDGACVKIKLSCGSWTKWWRHSWGWCSCRCQIAMGPNVRGMQDINGIFFCSLLVTEYYQECPQCLQFVEPLFPCCCIIKNLISPFSSAYLDKMHPYPSRNCSL